MCVAIVEPGEPETNETKLLFDGTRMVSHWVSCDGDSSTLSIVITEMQMPLRYVTYLTS